MALGVVRVLGSFGVCGASMAPRREAVGLQLPPTDSDCPVV